MSELTDLVHSHKGIRRFVEIGGYEGGSILTLALRFANRDIEFYSVESFMGNLSGSMDGLPLPSRKSYLDNLARFSGLRVHLVPGDSKSAGRRFDDASIDFVFIDGCQETAAVLNDIDAWLPKVSKTGIISGDDYNWPSVRSAVGRRFSRVRVTPSGCVWWRRLDEA